MKALEEVIADTLEIEAARVEDTLAYDEIEAWDSLGHVNLMLALESAYGVDIGEDEMVELTSVADIRAFLAERGAAPHAA